MSLGDFQVHIHDIVILRASGSHFSDASDELTLAELTDSQTDAVLAAHSALGHNIATERVSRRFRHGLRFFQLWYGETLAGTTWIVAGSYRYLDELAWRLPLSQDELWVRDVFISPAFRGRRLLSSFLALIISQRWPQCSCVWSDVERSNRQSVRAHTNAGFQLRDRVRAFDIAGRVLVRGPLMPWGERIIEIQPQRRLLWLRRDQLQRHLDLIA